MATKKGDVLQGTLTLLVLKSLSKSELHGYAIASYIKLASSVRVPKDVDDIITSRCSMCHAADPVWNGIITPPKGVTLDSHPAIARQAEAIRLYAVTTNAMPPNNITQMTRDERQVLAQWLAKR